MDGCAAYRNQQQLFGKQMLVTLKCRISFRFSIIHGTSSAWTMTLWWCYAKNKILKIERKNWKLEIVALSWYVI